MFTYSSLSRVQAYLKGNRDGVKVVTDCSTCGYSQKLSQAIFLIGSRSKETPCYHVQNQISCHSLFCKPPQNQLVLVYLCLFSTLLILSRTHNTLFDGFTFLNNSKLMLNEVILNMSTANKALYTQKYLQFVYYRNLWIISLNNLKIEEAVFDHL